MRIRIVLLLLLLILVASCSSPTIVIPTTTYISTPKSTLLKTIPVTSTHTFTPSPTNLPTLTYTSTPLPTWTPLSTLEPSAALSFVIDLLQDNAGCKLPCWWGITPGKTTWVEAQHFLESFSYSYGIRGAPNDYQVAEFGTPLSRSLGADPYAFGIRDGIIEDIFKIYFGNITASYNLVEMLNTYGQPDDILISAYYEPRYSNYMVVVAIFYLRTGILVRYNDNGGGLAGDKIEVCPQEATYPHLALWAPSLNLSLSEASSRYLDTRNWPAYRTIQEAAGMSIEAFYSTFLEPNNQLCLELSANDWLK